MTGAAAGFDPTKEPTVAGQALPLVAAQPGIWVADQLSPWPNAYAVAHCLDLRGPLDQSALSEAILQGMAQADTLQMAFTELYGHGVQIPDRGAPLPQPQVLDLRRQSDPMAAARQLMQQDLKGDVRLLSGRPLIRHLLLRVGEQHWLWYQRYHHIQLDGFSITELTRRIAQIYSARVRGQAAVPQPFTPFCQVVEEYQAYRRSAAHGRDVDYWEEIRRNLPEAASLSPLPLTGQAPSTRLLRQEIHLPQAAFRRLTQQGSGDGLVAADLAQALIALWLLRLCNRTSLSAGYIFMRRLGSVALDAAGPVINVLPMALRLEPGDTLFGLAGRLSKTLKSMRRHQRLDAEDILRAAGQSWEQAPLYGPVINFKAFDYQLEFAGLQCDTQHLAAGPVRDLELQLFIDEAGGCRLELLANAERYDAEQLAGHLRRLPLLLQQFAAQPRLPCSDAQLLLPEETRQLAAINATQAPLTAHSLASLIRQQAQQTPLAPALQDAEHCLSYAEMQEQVQALAGQLQQCGVQPGDIVAVALPRSVRLSLALQAIVSLGAAWLPLDTGYPDERLQLMLEDARPRLLITDSSQAARLAMGAREFIYDRLYAVPQPLPAPPAAPDPQQTAYIIYTSGSTGRPKGVMVSHRAIVNRLLWMQHQFPLGQDDVVLQKTPCSFDVSVWEFFWPLISGAKLVMAPPEAHRDPQQLQRLFCDYRITTTHFVPSMLAAFLHAMEGQMEGRIEGTCLRRVFCSGEALPTELARHWERRTGVPLFNLYGPTEAAVDVSWFPAFGPSLAALQGAGVPIGYPVWNTGLRILDGQLQPLPPGVGGDLYLTGVQLAQGYLQRPALTAGRFVADPFAQGQRMYRSGDLARWLADGAVEYLGRSDDQLKIRGQRIELGEIDAALQALPGVAQAASHALTLQQAGTSRRSAMDARQLVGYLVAQAPGELDLPALKERLAGQLPAHMVPAALVQLKALPLSANGKLDRRALPPPSQHGEPGGRAPKPGLERRIAQAFDELLGCGEITAEDDFFALGGHSLLALQLAATLRKELNLPVTIGHIMQAGKISALAALLSSLSSQASQEPAVRAGFEHLLWLRRSPGPTLFCLHPASGFAWQYSALQPWLEPHWSLVGVQSADRQGPLAQAKTLDDISQAHLQAIRRAQPHGPYYFLGFSLGGTLALALAAKLQAAGEQVAFVGLLDTWPPESQKWEKRRGDAQQDPVLQELNRERQQFIASQQQIPGMADDSTSALFDVIESNYASAVGLLQGARSSRFEGPVHLFVAGRTLPEGSDLQQIWQPWVGRLSTSEVDCSHVEIISPTMLRQVGPRLNALLSRF